MTKKYKDFVETKKEELNNISSDKLNEQFNSIFKQNENTKNVINEFKSKIKNDKELKSFFDNLIETGLTKRDLRSNYKDINFENTNVYEISVYNNPVGYLMKSYNIENEKYIIYLLSALWETLVEIYKDKAGEVFLKDILTLMETNVNLLDVLIPNQLNYYKNELESTRAKIINLEIELSNLRITESKLEEKIKEYESQ